MRENSMAIDQLARPTARESGCAECARLSRFSRRRFIQGALAAFGALALPATVSTRVAMATAGYTGDVLVVLSLRGGFDGLNAIVPAGDPNYLALRPNIGVPAAALLGLDSMFGLHPAMAPLMSRWQEGTFGAVHAVGQPSGTRSHFEATDEMDRAAPDSGLRTGWLDRAIGQRSMTTIFGALQLGSSLPSGAFAGDSPELALGSIGDFQLSGTSSADDPEWAAAEFARWSTALGSMYQPAPAAMRAPMTAALDAARTVANLVNSPYTPGATYPEGELGSTLKDIARLIKANIGVQIVCLDYDNWDMHEGMGRFDAADGWLNRQLSALAGGLAAFATDLGPAFNRTTVVTMSEFGRRVAENDSGGVDHGHGNAMLLLGGNVVGGQVHGNWPGLAEAALDDGDLAGANDFRTVLAEVLARRCGQTGLATVFPGADLANPLGVVRG